MQLKYLLAAQSSIQDEIFHITLLGAAQRSKYAYTSYLYSDNLFFVYTIDINVSILRAHITRRSMCLTLISKRCFIIIAWHFESFQNCRIIWWCQADSVRVQMQDKKNYTAKFAQRNKMKRNEK